MEVYFYDKNREKIYGNVVSVAVVNNIPTFIIQTQDGDFEYKPITIVFATAPMNPIKIFNA